MPAGALLALYTDGVVERRDHVIDIGIDALAAVLKDGADVADLVPDGGDDDAALLLARVLDAPPDITASLALEHDLSVIRPAARVRGRHARRLVVPSACARTPANRRRAREQRDPARQAADRAASRLHRPATC